MEKEIIIAIVLLSSMLCPFVLYIISDIIKEYKYRKQFNDLKIGDRYATLLTKKDDVFREPVYAYVEITDKKEKEGIYYVQYKFIRTGTIDTIPIANGHIINDAEYIIVAREKGATFNNDAPLDCKRRVFTEPLVSNKFHPCEKPISILNKLVILYSKQNSTILDPFMGSGTTGISAVKNDRDFIGIELIDKYFDIARARIDNENRQMKMFN